MSNVQNLSPSSPIAGNQWYTSVSDTTVSASKVSHALNHLGQGSIAVNSVSGTLVPVATGNYSVLDNYGNPVIIPVGSVINSLVLSSDVAVAPTTVTAQVYLINPVSTLIPSPTPTYISSAIAASVFNNSTGQTNATVPVPTSVTLTGTSAGTALTTTGGLNSNMVGSLIYFEQDGATNTIAAVTNATSGMLGFSQTNAVSGSILVNYITPPYITGGTTEAMGIQLGVTTAVSAATAGRIRVTIGFTPTLV